MALGAGGIAGWMPWALPLLWPRQRVLCVAGEVALELRLVARKAHTGVPLLLLHCVTVSSSSAASARMPMPALLDSPSPLHQAQHQCAGITAPPRPLTHLAPTATGPGPPSHTHHHRPLPLSHTPPPPPPPLTHTTTAPSPPCSQALQVHRQHPALQQHPLDQPPPAGHGRHRQLPSSERVP